MRERPCADPEKESSPAAVDSERRVAVRKVLIVKKMTLAEIVIGDGGVPRIHYVYINDISETGIRISSDILFPSDKKIRLKLLFNKPITVETCLRWKRDIGVNNYLDGMEFITDTEAHKKGVHSLLAWAEPYFEHSSFKLNTTLYLQTDLEGPLAGVYAYALSISPCRLEILSNTPFPEEKEFTLAFSLRQDKPAILTKAQVIHLADTTPEELELDMAECRNYTIWLEFSDSRPVKEHLMDVLAEEPPISHQ
jgi:hypothetical protein